MPSLRDLPAVDRVLREAPQLVERWGRERVVVAVRAELARWREGAAGPAREPAAGPAQEPAALLRQIVAAVAAALEDGAQPGLRPVFNLTGVVLHTNLGRAALPPPAAAAARAVALAPSNLEFDLETGQRGDRDDHVAPLLAQLTGAEAATVVNNNAAAVLLTLNTLAREGEVPVSRGELIEIGGAFRLPDIMEASGCILVEVGTTNRTRLQDYEQAVNDRTALLLKVHPSNYEIRGFVQSVAAPDLAALARRHGLPLVFDLGSGSLVDFAAYDLPPEPTAAQVLRQGADLVSFSGDKLLGGPQCGIIAGRRALVEKVKNNPLKRALRIDKMNLAALAEVLKLYQAPSRLAETLPALAALTRPPDALRALAEGLLPEVAAALAPRYGATAVECRSQVGSGALPVATLPSFALRIAPADSSDQALRRLAQALRRLPAPVIGRLRNGACFLDLRCLEPERETEFRAQLPRLQDAGA